MADWIAIFADERGLGRLERRVAVRGKIEIGEQSRARAELCLTPRGVFLVAALDRSRGVAIDLLARPDLRYETGSFGDRLRIGEIGLGLAPGRGDEVRELIGLGRMRTKPGRAERDFPALKHVQATSALESAFLATHLALDEVLLAWLGSATRLPIHSDILGETQSEIRLCITDRRHELIALSPVGDVREVALGDAPLEVDKSFARAKVSCDGQTWQSLLGNADEYAVAAGLIGYRGPARLREAARLNFLARDADQRWTASALSLLELAAARGDALSSWARLFVRAEPGVQGMPPAQSELEAAIAALNAAGLEEAALADLWSSWRFGGATARRLLEPLLAFGARAEPWALGLHVAVHALPDASERGPFDRARADIALAEHYLANGQTKAARELLEGRLGEMPSEAVEELLPPSDADLTRGAGGQSLTIRLHELLARARGEAERPDARTLAVLARLQPLVLGRLRSLSEAADGDLAERARRTIEVLESGGLTVDGSAPASSELGVLGELSIERVLCHPLVREGGALLGRLQALLAGVPSPDHGVLRDYCEALALEPHPDAAGALRDAARALGVRDLYAYVSRGNKSVGLRAYEGTPPFVLIGVRHLEGDPEFTMTAAELRFAIGAEVAHLRYGHTRVTSSEVWAGALSKSKQGLDFALGMLPMLKGWRFADKVGRVASRIPISAARRVLDGAGALSGRMRSGLAIVPSPRPINDGVLSRINEELVAAHRVMQLTADRAGLLLAGDLRSAVRGLLLIRRDHRRLLADAERDGLETILARRDATGAIEHQDLAIRVAALIAFFLSDDYKRLRKELLTGSAA